MGEARRAAASECVVLAHRHELRSSQQRVALDELQTDWQRLLVGTVGEAVNEAAEERQQLLPAQQTSANSRMHTASSGHMISTPLVTVQRAHGWLCARIATWLNVVALLSVTAYSSRAYKQATQRTVRNTAMLPATVCSVLLAVSVWLCLCLCVWATDVLM